MKNWRTVILVVVSIFVFWFIKFHLHFPTADISVISIILSIASILFGFLVGFFISELWTRYTEIRGLQGSRSSSGLDMIKYAEHFFGNKKFREDFRKRVEASVIADEATDWNEWDLEIPYFRDIENSFDSVKIKNSKDSLYLEKTMDRHHEYVESTVKLSTLYKERLLGTEWFIILVLSFLMAMSILFLDTSHLLYQIIVLAFPPIITLALSIIYDLDRLLWSKETIGMEPIQRILDVIDVKRFYLKGKKQFISKHVKDYRTEDDLTGYAKKVYLEIDKKRKENND